MLILALTLSAHAQSGACPSRCKTKCKKTCNTFDYACNSTPWKFGRVCGKNGKYYKNECCAKCAGTKVKYYCEAPSISVSQRLCYSACG